MCEYDILSRFGCSGTDWMARKAYRNIKFLHAGIPALVVLGFVPHCVERIEKQYGLGVGHYLTKYIWKWNLAKGSRTT